MRQCVMHKNNNSALDILELFPFNNFNAIWHNVKPVRGISTKFIHFVRHNQTTYYAQQP